MKTVLQVLAVLAGISLAGGAYAQITSGKVVAVEKRTDRLLLRMQTGAMKIEVRSPSVIHVLYSPDGAFPDRPNPVIVPSSWPPVSWNFASSGKDITLSTTQLRVVVDRDDGYLLFKDEGDKVLLREGGIAGRRTMTPVTVNGEKTYHATDFFSPAADEAFYGLGQHQART